MPSISTIVRAPAEIPARSRCVSYSTTNPEKKQVDRTTSPITAGCYGVSYDTHPASSTLRRWRLRRLIVAVLTWPFHVAFGCRHAHITRPLSNHQTCLDCGAVRSYLYPENRNDDLWIGRWVKAVQG